MLEDNALKLKPPVDDQQGYAQGEPPVPSDDEDFEKQIKKLEFKETNLKFSMRRIVAGFLTACAALILGVFTLHLVLPESWRWLSPADMDKIKDVALTVFGGLVMSIGTLFYSKK